MRKFLILAKIYKQYILYKMPRLVNCILTGLALVYLKRRAIQNFYYPQKIKQNRKFLHLSTQLESKQQMITTFKIIFEKIRKEKPHEY